MTVDPEKTTVQEHNTVPFNHGVGAEEEARMEQDEAPVEVAGTSTQR